MIYKLLLHLVGHYNSKEAPFSEKLMMYAVYLLSNFGIGGQSFGAAFSMRHDLNFKSAIFAKDVYEYAREGVKIMISNGWMEEPPQMANRDELLRIVIANLYTNGCRRRGMYVKEFLGVCA